MKHLGPVLLIVYLLVIAMGLIGYVKNIIHLTECDFKESYKAEIIYTIGIPVAPMGAVCGWIDFGK